MDSLDIAEAAAREFEAHNWEAKLGADSAGFTAAIENAQRMGEGFDGKNYDAKLGADTSGLASGEAQAAAMTASVDSMNGEAKLGADTSGIASGQAQAQAATAAVDAMNGEAKFTGDNSDLLGSATAAQAAVASVPDKKTTHLDADATNYEGVVARTLSLIRSIPGRVQTVMSILGDPQTIIGHVRRGLMQVQNMPPTRIQMDSSQARQATVALNGTERGIRNVTGAMATLNNVRGADGSMWRRFGSALISASQAATRATGGFLRMVGVTTTLGQASASAAAATTATAASIAQTGQAATGAAASVGSTAAGMSSLAVAAAMAAPALVVLGAALIVIGGALGAVLAVIMPVVGGFTLLAGTVGAVAIGFGLIGAAALKLATDFGTVRAATQRVKDAQVALNAARESGDPTRIAEAEKELARAQNEAAVAADKASGSSKEYATQLQRMGTELDQLKGKFQEAFQGASTELARISADTMELAQQHLPALGAASETSIVKMEEGFKGAHDSSTSLKDVLQEIPGIMGDIAGTVGNLQSAFASFFDVANPMIKDFTQYVEDAAEKLATWADSQAGRDQIRDFLQAAVPIAQAFADGIQQVCDVLGSLSNEHAPAAEAAVTFFFDAVTFGISALEVMLSALEAIIGALRTLIGVAKDAAAAVASIGSGGTGSGGTTGMATNPGMAYGGDLSAYADGGDFQAFADGGDSGAHYVNGPRTMSVGASTALYGEALSGENREYAFPLGGGWRFITEQPGFDKQSFGLWADLGNRKGFFDAISGGANKDGSQAQAHKDGAGAPPPMQGDGGRSRDGDGTKIEHLVRHTNDAANRADAAASNGERRIESAIRGMERTVNDALRLVAAETSRIPERIKSAVDHNNIFDKNTRTSVLKGLSREASKGAFEGSLR